MNAETVEVEQKSLEVDLEKISSPVLRRLIEEVRNEEATGMSKYSRYHNRHNRSGGPRPWVVDPSKT